MTKESKKSVYLQELLEMQNNHSKMMHQIVIDAIQEQETLVKRLSDEENNIYNGKQLGGDIYYNKYLKYKIKYINNRL